MRGCIVAEDKLGFALAQLQQTSAEIGNTNARYRVALATLNYEEGCQPMVDSALAFYPYN
jgi:hypothetical protein